MKQSKEELEQILTAIREAEMFIKEAKVYIKKRNVLHKSRLLGEYYDNTMAEHGTLVHRSILLSKKLVEWRKR